MANIIILICIVKYNMMHFDQKGEGGRRGRDWKLGGCMCTYSESSFLVDYVSGEEITKIYFPLYM